MLRWVVGLRRFGTLRAAYPATEPASPWRVAVPSELSRLPYIYVFLSPYRPTRLRLPDFMTLGTGRLYPQEYPGTHF